MLRQRLRRWLNIQTVLGQPVVFAGLEIAGVVAGHSGRDTADQLPIEKTLDAPVRYLPNGIGLISDL